MKKPIYLDNGATTTVAKEVVMEMLPYFTRRYGNASSLYSLGQQAAAALESARKKMAEKMGAEPDEIIFTSGGSEANNLAIKGVAFASKPGSHIITSKFEHPSVLEACRSLEEKGFAVTYINADNEGIVKLDELKKAITDKTVLVSIMAANNEIGTIQPIKEIGEICREKGVLFHTDAVQAFAKINIGVKEIGISMMSLSAHKIHGPKGVGALFVKNGTLLKKLLDGGPQERNLRAGTENIAGIVGFAKASTLLTSADLSRMSSLRDKLTAALLEIPNTRLNGSRQNRLCNNINVSFRGVEGEAVLFRLDEKGIAVSTGSACSSKELKPSHVLTAIGLGPIDSHGSIRLTLSKYTTEKEIDYVISVLPKVVEDLRRISPVK